MKIVYDGDGNRIFKTVAGVTTGYLLDDHSPTGYVQVLDEVQGPFITRSYVYGLELIEQDRISGSQQSTSYNVYDGPTNLPSNQYVKATPLVQSEHLFQLKIERCPR